MRTNTERGLSKTRIEALSDGVVAIAMTLLILEVDVVDGAGHRFPRGPHTGRPRLP
jgi:uncharacterized membrane protein